MEAIVRQCEILLKAQVQSFRAIHGGDINEAFLLQTTKGPFFLKYNSSAQAGDLLKSEAKGLSILRESRTIKIPKMLHFHEEQTHSFLILEYIESGPTTPEFWENFGRQLAQLHRQSHPHFGLDHSTFIGSLPQSNRSHLKWSDFYIHERLAPQLQLAFDHQKVPKDFIPRFEQLYQKLDQICPEEVPSLIHGDLWNGNFVAAKDGTVVLIDPSVAFSHREMDWAMGRLFGGFDPLFYKTYTETFPLENNIEERMPIYQLYYLLVHVNLFGGSYVSSVKAILNRYV